MSISRWRITILVLSAILASASGRADEFISEFETSFDDWQQQWHEDNVPGGSDGIATHSTQRGFLDGTSLQFDMGDGFGDDGTLWIEKQFAVSDVQPTHVSVTFQLFNLEQSDFNAFQMKAAISTDDPDEQIDFATIGSTDTAAGWVPFAYDAIIPPSPSPAWVAVGIRVAFETHRDYWIDRVVVTTAAVPEPVSAGLLLVGMAFCPLSRKRPSPSLDILIGPDCTEACGAP